VVDGMLKSAMSQQTFQFLFSGSGIKTLISLVIYSSISNGFDEFFKSIGDLVWAICL